jgi:hypothetical protein
LKNCPNFEKNANLWSKSAKKRNVRHAILPIFIFVLKKNGKKIKMAAKNQDGVRYTIFSTEIQLKRYLAALQEFFLCKSVDNEAVYQKKIIREFGFW